MKIKTLIQRRLIKNWSKLKYEDYGTQFKSAFIVNKNNDFYSEKEIFDIARQLISTLASL